MRSPAVSSWAGRVKEQHMTPQHASQSHGQVRRTGVETTAADADQAISTGTSASAEQASDVDSILDEIDSVIETNAAAFVQGFVQKGGQ